MPRQARGIGEPFRDCSNCKTVINLSDLLNEWGLLNAEEQAEMSKNAFWTGAINGGLWGYVLGAFLGFLVSSQFAEITSLHAMLAGFLGTALGYFIYRPVVENQLKQQILESEERMGNKKYRKRLTELGFIKS